MLMPAQTHRFHLDWRDPRVDTLEFLNMAARRGEKFADLNACVSADDTAWNLHWGNGPLLNHYDWIWTGRRDRFGRERRRPMTHTELHRPINLWHDEEIARWRRGAHGGVKPATVRKRQRQARRRSVVPCWELKSSLFAEQDVAEQLLEDVRASGGRAYFMALVTMRKWRQKARAVRAAGGQFALLAHGAPKPPDFDRAEFDAVWGRFA